MALYTFTIVRPQIHDYGSIICSPHTAFIPPFLPCAFFLYTGRPSAPVWICVLALNGERWSHYRRRFSVNSSLHSGTADLLDRLCISTQPAGAKAPIANVTAELFTPMTNTVPGLPILVIQHIGE